MLSIAAQIFSPLVNAGTELVTTVTEQKQCPTLEERVRTAVRCGAIPAKFTAAATKKALDSGLHFATTTLGLTGRTLVQGFQCARSGAQHRLHGKNALSTPVVREAVVALAFGGEFISGTGCSLASCLGAEGSTLLLDALTGAVSAGSAYGAFLGDPFLTPVTAAVGATAYELNQVVQLVQPALCFGGKGPAVIGDAEDVDPQVKDTAAVYDVEADYEEEDAAAAAAKQDAPQNA